ncbi:MAG: penicillin-binding transpeptidase domain-containing protein [Pyrinomonadaceae bacterium]
MDAANLVTADELDEALRQAAVDAIGEREGAVLIIDPQNGRIRAIVNRRLAFEQAFPPGSAIKPFTALAAMRAGTVDASSSTRVHCRTNYTARDFSIACSHPRSDAPFDLTQALAYSCNYYFARLAERTSEGGWTNTLAAFGFGERTGANANGESPGRLWRGAEWHPRTALGEGEALLVTPAQMLSAYAALTNGGHLYRLQLMPESKFSAQQRARVMVPAQMRATLMRGMSDALVYGTASSAGFNELPLRVIGKTGTSTDSNNFRTQGWFIGFASAAKRGAAATAAVPSAASLNLGVLVFLRRAHGSDSAHIARRIFETHSRLRVAPREETENVAPAFVDEGAANLRIRVRSIREQETYTLPLEEYVTGVVRTEASVEDQWEALKAQAVASRTYALKNLGRHRQDNYDLCSTTHRQLFKSPEPRRANSPAARAVAETAGLVIKDEREAIIDAYFHAACGGATANIKTLWGTAQALPYWRACAMISAPRCRTGIGAK